MVIKSFPPLSTASPEGLLAIGGDLEVETLKLAYSHGIFPWPTEEFPLLWFAPPKRAIIDIQDFKVPKRFHRELKKKNFHYKVDQNFPRVIQACAEGLTRDTAGTWITPEMIRAFIRFHEVGLAHSFECYNDSDQLVGGLYGVSMGKMFAGESMFYWESGASKAALIFCIDYLKDHGVTWMDVQMLSPLLMAFGAKEISREEFMTRLKDSLQSTNIL